MSRIVAVVVSWNGGESLERCVASLRRQALQRIIVVDNGSDAAARNRLEKLYGGASDVELILLADNKGFAEGADIGLRAGLEAGAEAVLLATQDICLEEGVVGLLEAALRRPGAGIAGPLVLDTASGRELSRGERLIPALLCLPRTLLRHRDRATEPYEVSGVMGCLLLISAACARATGGFDARLFAYYEEVDLCLRARSAGFHILCVPAARVHHDGMRGFLAGFTPLAAELKARNLVWLMRKHGTALRWLSFVPTYLALVLCSGALYLLRGRPDVAAALGRGLAAGLGRMPCESASAR